MAGREISQEGTAFYADRGRIEAWFAQARVGDAVVYAIGPALDPKQAVAALVSRWAKARSVLPFKTRDNGVLQHLVCKLDLEASAAPIAPKLKLAAEMEDTPEGAILRAISRCANMGLPCPANPELAKLAGLRDAEAARYRFNLLREGGHIEVRQDSTFAGRRVLVVATGKWTAEGNTPPTAALVEGGR